MPTLSLANNRTIDSLQNTYEKATHDTTKIITLLSWGEEIYLSKPDSALVLWTKARDIADKCLAGNSDFSELELLTLKKGKAEAFVNIGYIYGQKGNPQLDLKYSIEAAQIFENLLAENLGVSTFFIFKNKTKKGLASAYNNIGAIYENQGEIDKGLEYYF